MSHTAEAPRPIAPADLLTPKLISTFREGYTIADLGRDFIAGLTVAVVALPLSMAIGIASGATPAHGLVTAIVAGFLISALGGSRFQIGGPTAAFIVVVFNTIDRHGYEGLLLATLIAGAILIVVGALRLGTFIKYIPYPVVTGFTAGIAVSIFVSQIKDLLGLNVSLPGDFIPKIAALGTALPQTNLAAVAVALASLAIIVALRIARPKWPGFLIALIIGGGAAIALGLDVPTIGSAFGGIPRSLPAPTLPPMDIAKVREVLPDAVTIALLAGIESLLSAVVADGMTGRRHRSNVELIAQGVANVASSLFAGLPATGAIARTATNIRAGARSPISGMLHAAFLLIVVLVAAPVLSYVPLAALAAILTFVAWNIGEFGHIRTIMINASWGDRVVLLVTFFLTVLVDLTVAIEAGVALAALMFMHRMANSVEIEERKLAGDDSAAAAQGVIVYRITGPFFFGATQKLASVLDRIGEAPRAYVLDLGAVPLVDSTAVAMLESFVARAESRKTDVIFAAAAPAVRKTLAKFGIAPPHVRFADSVDAALTGTG
ncbi:MAG TPA: SulP family inorganic anion transporter [Bauldia sp.]|nr:SulP family inorganic anion transporter [Bauldia sp.]